MYYKCFFNCTNDSHNLITCGVKRIETIKECSAKRGDGMFDLLTGVESIKCHKCCVSTYTSKNHLKRFLSKRKYGNAGSDSEKTIPSKHSRRSSTSHFNFKDHCFICGEICLNLDCRHPDRCRRVIQCQSACCFKQNILNICNGRKDSQANEVRLRISAAVSDLHAANGQYHYNCYKRFMGTANDKTPDNWGQSTIQSDDSAFAALIDEMTEKKSHIWNSLEIQESYSNHGGAVLTRRKLIEQLMNHFGDELHVFAGNGAASLFIFNNNASDLIKLTDHNDDIDVRPIAKIIKKECSEKAADRDTDASSHPAGIVNIANGLVSSSNVNVDRSLEIGQQQMRELEMGWPTKFHGTLKKTITTLAEKSIKIDNTPVYDTEIIYTRVIGLQQSRDFDIKEVLSYELSAVPQALFNENGDIRAQGKAKLKTKLQIGSVESSFKCSTYQFY